MTLACLGPWTIPLKKTPISKKKKKNFPVLALVYFVYLVWLCFCLLCVCLYTGLYFGNSLSLDIFVSSVLPFFGWLVLVWSCF
jgi:hypothetical protein